MIREWLLPVLRGERKSKFHVLPTSEHICSDRREATRRRQRSSSLSHSLVFMNAHVTLSGLLRVAVLCAYAFQEYIDSSRLRDSN